MRQPLKRSGLVELLTRLARARDEAQGRPGYTGGLWNEEFANLRLQLERFNSDLEKTTFLREYTGSLIAIGRPADEVARRFRFGGFDSLDLSRIYPALKSHELPAECGITSLFYVKLLCSLGYRAYQYSFGFLEKPYERLVHSVCLVDIDCRGARRLIIQDPYWNLSYTDEQGEAIDFLAFLSCLKRRQYGQVAVAASSVTTALVIDDTSVYPALSDACKGAMAEAFTNSDGSRKAEIPIVRNYATLMQSPYHHVENAFVDALRRHGLAEPFLFAYTLPAAAIVGGRGRGDLQRKIDAILREP